MDRNAIIDFVKNTLGCGCSDDVFEHIEMDRDVNFEGGRMDYKLNIGNKLLVYIIVPDKKTDAGKLVGDAFIAGISERDARGFNRIRVVIVTTDRTIKNKAIKKFENMDFPDDRVHMHIIKPEILTLG